MIRILDYRRRALAAEARADKAERSVAVLRSVKPMATVLSELARANARVDELEQLLAANPKVATVAEARRELAEARTELAALRSAHDRDRERIQRLQADLERLNEERGEFGHFEDRKHPRPDLRLAGDRPFADDPGAGKT